MTYSMRQSPKRKWRVTMTFRYTSTIEVEAENSIQACAEAERLHELGDYPETFLDHYDTEAKQL